MKIHYLLKGASVYFDKLQQQQPVKGRRPGRLTKTSAVLSVGEQLQDLDFWEQSLSMYPFCPCAHSSTAGYRRTLDVCMLLCDGAAFPPIALSVLCRTLPVHLFSFVGRAGGPFSLRSQACHWFSCLSIWGQVSVEEGNSNVCSLKDLGTNFQFCYLFATFRNLA